MTRRIIGNLDCEHEFAAGRGQPLSGAALERIAPLATLLRLFASEGDAVWTPAPVDPALVPAVEGLPAVRLESGPLDRLPGAERTLAWGVTGSVARVAKAVAPHGRRVRADAPLWERVWQLPQPSPEVCASVNHRAFCLGVTRELGCPLPYAEFVRSYAELAQHLRGCSHENFVLKAPLSAAGRARIRFQRDRLEQQSVRDRVEPFFAKWDGLLLEPWMDRVADYGALGLVSDRGVALLGVHEQHIGAEDGRFLGITLHLSAPPDGVNKEDEAALSVAARRAGEKLRDAGYRGPFSVDSWRYRLPDGKTRLQPIGEINARMTMGLVARAGAERLFPGAVEPVTLLLDDEGDGGGYVLLERPRVRIFT